MMFSWQKGANALSMFKWRGSGELSLETGLLKDAPLEIELSGYGRVPSPGSESPSGLLNGESLNIEPISNLDLFFERLYNYYCEKGLWCILIKWVVELLSVAFIICFSGFLLLYVDWNGLRNAKCGMDAVESGVKPCDLVNEALHQHPLIPMTFSKVLILIYLVLSFLVWIFHFLRFFVQLKGIIGVRQFYYNSLHVTDNEIQTMGWPTILEKVVQLQSLQHLCVVKDLSAHDVVMRLMRKENYLIGMINKGVLAFPIPSWFPEAGPTVKIGSNRSHHRLILTKTLEWTLNWLILQPMFDSKHFCLKRDFISNRGALKFWFNVAGIFSIFLTPLVFTFMLFSRFLRHAEQFYNHPSTASSRRWSNLSRWILREFNEVEHLFKHRIDSCAVHASDYLKQFPSPIISIIAKFISFVSGGFAAILIIIAFLEESLLEGHIFGRNLFWYAAVFGTITAVSRAAVADEVLVLDPERAMSMVVQHTHYMPKHWRGKENTETVRMEFEILFQYTGRMLLEEMASVLLTPYLLMFVVPKRLDDILKFISDFTVDVEGVGSVCSFSSFDFRRHGNSNYGSPYNTHRTKRSSQGKMEKSFLSFQSDYPSWEPKFDGKQLQMNLRTFKEEILQGKGARHVYFPPITWRGSLRGPRDSNTIFSREMLHHTNGFQLDSLWLIYADHKNYPYLLDLYYISRPHASINHTQDAAAVPSELNKQHPDEFWMTNDEIQNGSRCKEDYWGHHCEERSETHLGVSTSTPVFRESVFRHHDSSNFPHTTRNHWWARSSPKSTRLQASFLEPPDFNHFPAHNYNDDFSERSFEDQEAGKMSYTDYNDDLDFEAVGNIPSLHFDGKLSRTVYYNDDLEAGGDNLSLHFDNIYSSRPPESST
ncbi:hypothetical protein K2173_018480 [Erythroxylum novogranatense]|uniref:Autophagy-related protein 9 n=1 Tax=Erythroxylum novogranatense TaxID=1862640 RepID=A0AAV8UDE6_9ROSI|nr:hypothetical protein K2173_018480 [Erythroxylum novogranatense]